MEPEENAHYLLFRMPYKIEEVIWIMDLILNIHMKAILEGVLIYQPTILMVAFVLMILKPFSIEKNGSALKVILY